MASDFTGLATGDTVEVLVRGRVSGLGLSNGIYIGQDQGHTYIDPADAVGFQKIVVPWSEGDAVRVKTLDMTLVRTTDGWWLDPTTASMPDGDVDRYQSLGELEVLYAPGRQ